VTPSRWLPTLALVLPLAGAALVPVVTAGRTAVPTPAWVGVAVALALVLALARGGAPSARRDLPVAAGLGLAAAAAHLPGDLVLGHDVFDHAWGAWAYLQAWRGGDFLPIWLHHLGVGQPMPLFYGPLAFWAMAPAAATGGGAARMLASGAVLASVVSALSAWLATARWSGDRRAALVAAAALAYAPYRLLDANYRIAIAESWAIALFPLALLAHERLLAGATARRFVAAAAATAAVALAHPLSLPPLAAALAVVALAHPGWRAPRASAAALARALGRGAGAGLAGLGAAGFFVVPLVAELRFLPLEFSTAERGRLTYVGQGLHPLDLVARRLWDRVAYAESGRQPAGADEMSFYFGLVLLGALAAGLVLARRAAPGSPLGPLALAGGFALVSSLWVVARVEGLLPGLPVLQFPWRFLGAATALAALAAGFVVAALPVAGRRARWLATALALALVADGFPFTGAVARLERSEALTVSSRRVEGELSGLVIRPPWPMRVHGSIFPPDRCCADVGQAGLVYREYMTHGTRKLTQDLMRSGVGLMVTSPGDEFEIRPFRGLPYASREPGPRRPREALRFERGGGEIVVELPDRRGGRVVVAEQWFPGWLVEAGGAARRAARSREGLLRVVVPEGVDRVRFRFDRWRWDRTLGWLLSAASVAALLLAAWRRPGARAA
jgi:hypothetical protein